MAEVDQLDRLLLREVGVGDDHFLDSLGGEHLRQVLQLAERAQAVVGPSGERDVADDVDLGARAIGQGVGDCLDVLAGTDQNRPAAVAGLFQKPSRYAQVELTQRRDVEGPEDQRPIEDEVAREVLAVG